MNRHYLALLRGINVGGRNVIAMTALRDCFEAHGLTDVRTYIQSGNVLFESRAASAALLTRTLEALLSATFGYRASLVLLSRTQLRRIVEGAPERFGTAPGRYRYDVLFLKPPLRSAAALADLPLKEGVDAAYSGPGVIYVSRLISRAAQSRLSRVASLPMYQNLTIRNWNTTTALLRLMESEAA